MDTQEQIKVKTKIDLLVKMTFLNIWTKWTVNNLFTSRNSINDDYYIGWWGGGLWWGGGGGGGGGIGGEGGGDDYVDEDENEEKEDYDDDNDDDNDDDDDDDDDGHWGQGKVKMLSCVAKTVIFPLWNRESQQHKNR